VNNYEVGRDKIG